jgi:hypothetical protein
MESPKVYATFSSGSFRRLERFPVGSKPKLVFFFDEAHLLFQDMPKNSKIVRLSV